MKIQISSLSYLQNWKTRFVYFLLIPLISLCLLVLINAQYTNRFQWFVAVATTTLSGGTLAMSSMAELFVMDRNLRVDRELVVNRPFSVKYWGSKTLTAILAGVILIIINLGVLWVLRVPLSLLVRALIVAPVIVMSGTIVGFAAAIAAWQQSNAYFYLNIVNAFAMVVSGALILIDQYPGWLRMVSVIFPFSHTIRFVITGQGGVLQDLMVDAIWLVVGLTIYGVQVRMILKKSSQIW